MMIILGIIGIVLISLGYLLWKKERISLLHSYHYDKVSEENKKTFCTISGIGIIIIGIGFLLTGFAMDIIEYAWSMLPFTVGFVIGLAMLIYAGLRYNH